MAGEESARQGRRSVKIRSLSAAMRRAAATVSTIANKWSSGLRVAWNEGNHWSMISDRKGGDAHAR